MSAGMHACIRITLNVCSTTAAWAPDPTRNTTQASKNTSRAISPESRQIRKKKERTRTSS